jgi:transposase
MKELITQEEWDFMKVFLPLKKPTGRPRVDDRKLLNGIIFILKTGCRWADMPSEYGNGKTANRRFRELEGLGFFKKINQQLLINEATKVNLKKNLNR